MSRTDVENASAFLAPLASEDQQNLSRFLDQLNSGQGISPESQRWWLDRY